MDVDESSHKEKATAKKEPIDVVFLFKKGCWMEVQWLLDAHFGTIVPTGKDYIIFMYPNKLSVCIHTLLLCSCTDPDLNLGIWTFISLSKPPNWILQPGFQELS